MENETQISTKLRNLMLGALYKIGDPEKQDSILEAWELSKLFDKHFFKILFKDKKDLPALFNETTKKWSFSSTFLSTDYTSKEE